MVELMLSIPSIGRALRSGVWMKCGIHPISEALLQRRLKVHWSEGDDSVTVKDLSRNEGYQTSPDDPDIQMLDLIAAWDAEYHVPKRLTAEFEGKPELNPWGGPLWTERQSRSPR